MTPVHSTLSYRSEGGIMSRSGLLVVLGAGCLVLAAACSDETGPEPERFTASLTGAAEQPNPVTTNATGTATFTVRGTTVDFSITAANLVDAIAAHIHGPATSAQNAGVLVTLFAAAPPGVDVANGNLSAGTFPSATYALTAGITVDSVLTLLRNGMAYVNVHTVANTAGHMRGQVAED
jgi:hypothetical protein